VLERVRKQAYVTFIRQNELNIEVKGQGAAQDVVDFIDSRASGANDRDMPAEYREWLSGKSSRTCTSINASLGRSPFRSWQPHHGAKAVQIVEASGLGTIVIRELRVFVDGGEQEMSWINWLMPRENEARPQRELDLFPDKASGFVGFLPWKPTTDIALGTEDFIRKADGDMSPMKTGIEHKILSIRATVGDHKYYGWFDPTALQFGRAINGVVEPADGYEFRYWISRKEMDAVEEEGVAEPGAYAEGFEREEMKSIASWSV